MTTKPKWLILVPVVAGVALLGWLLAGRSAPERTAPQERTRAVRIIEVPSVQVVPRAVGYGSVRPSQVWEAVAEVSGQIIELHPQLKKGAILPKGSRLVRIDPTGYQLAIAQYEADLQSTEAELAEKDVKEANTRASLVIEEEALRLNEKELERKRRLFEKGSLSGSEFEQQQRTVLAQKQSVQGQRNALRLLPTERRLLAARLARFQAQLEGARLDLAHTTIELPFDGRIAEARVERTEYVRQGDVIAEVDGIDVAEVEAQIPMVRMRPLIKPQQDIDLSTGGVQQALGLSASIRLPDLGVEWEGRVTRVSDTIDPQTRTVGVIVEVDDPYRQAKPGIRPPLVKGMFVEVEFHGRPRGEAVVIPRTALHEQHVYVVDNQNRLRRQQVTVGITQPTFAVVESGLSPGEAVVISDVVPAIDGTLLKPTLDHQALARLVRDASGGPPP